MADSAGVRLQALSQKKQAIVLARMASTRSANGDFTAPELVAAFDGATLPRPAKVSNVLSALARDGLIARREAGGSWWLTPRGRAESFTTMNDVDLQIATSEAAAADGASLGHLTHPVLPPSWAPVEILRALSDFLTAFPFDTNVFAMTRFPAGANGEFDPKDRLSVAIERARHVCSDHGLTLHLASDRVLVDDLWGNVLAHMWGCRYGVAFFEDDSARGINYNLTIEVGGMLLAGRRTALLKDRTVPELPTDLVGRIYKSIDLSRPATVSTALHRWMRDDLGLGRCGGCPT